MLCPNEWHNESMLCLCEAIIKNLHISEDGDQHIELEIKMYLLDLLVGNDALEQKLIHHIMNNADHTVLGVACNLDGDIRHSYPSDNLSMIQFHASMEYVFGWNMKL